MSINFKQLIFATLSAFLFLVVVNNLLFSIVFPEGPPDQYENMREKPLRFFHLVAFLVEAFLLAFIYPIGYRGGSPRVEGIRFGMYMGFVVSFPHFFHTYAMVNVDFYSAVLAIVWTVAIWGIAGILIALVYGRRSPS